VLITSGRFFGSGALFKYFQYTNESTASSPLKTSDPESIRRAEVSHVEVIEANSSGDSEFAGLYNTFELKATILNTAVREALVQRQAEYYQWDAAQVSTEREKATQENSAEAAVSSLVLQLLSDEMTTWRTKNRSGEFFLMLAARRYVGQAKKDRRLDR
jgi:hypothetical protein